MLVRARRGEGIFHSEIYLLHDSDAGSEDMMGGKKFVEGKKKQKSENHSSESNLVIARKN